MPDESLRPDLAVVMAEIERRVGERRRAGEYPPELEEDLRRHLDLVAASTPVDDALGVLLDRLEKTAAFDEHRPRAESRLPLGGPTHRFLGQVTSRQTEAIYEQVRRHAAALQAVLAVVADRLPRAGQAWLEAQVTDLAVRLGDLSREVSRLCASAAGVTGDSRRWYSSLRLHAALYGDPAATRAGLARVAELVREPALDLGCGLGTLLDLLHARAVAVTGVDRDAEMVAFCRERGRDAVHADAAEHLEGELDGTLGTVVALGLVELLEPGRLDDLIAVSAAKLRPGGRVVVGTGGAAPADPLWRRPVPVELLQMLVEEAGLDIEDVFETSPGETVLVARRR